MSVFVLNCGSSSIKYRVFAARTEEILSRGLLDRVGSAAATLHHAAGSAELPEQGMPVVADDHEGGIGVVLDAIGGIEIAAVGHRVVHGGAAMTESRIIDREVIGAIESHTELAPLHNPANLAGIAAATAAIPAVPHVAVFDTAFLTTLPARAYRYAVPADWYRHHHVRKYGFHGTSHHFVTQRAAELLGKAPTEINLITCHLGNGCSVTAIAGGRAVDHSMGMTPLEGLVMGTRSGDIDPAVVLHMIDHGLSPAAVREALNHESGLAAVSGGWRDMRDVLAAAAGSGEATLALEMFVYRLAKYVGAYAAVLPPVDAVVLTGGIGENAAPVRAMLAAMLEALGVELDDAANASITGGATGRLTADGSRLAMWCIPTDEELMIARDTARLAGLAG